MGLVAKRLSAWLIFVQLLNALAAHAFTPPPWLPLSQRVKASTHIFVGEIRDVYFISTSGQRISPRAAAQQMDQLHMFPTIESVLQVREPLMWNTGKVAQTIRLRELVPMLVYQREDRAKRFAKILARERADIGQRYIFLTDMVSQRGRRTYFDLAYRPYFRLETEQKAAVQKEVKKLTADKRHTDK